MNLTLTTDQLNNLKVFLNRVQLSGQEVPAYVDLVNVISNAESDTKVGIIKEEVNNKDGK